MFKDKGVVGRIKREKGYLYYVDSDGYVWKCRLKRGQKKEITKKEKENKEKQETKEKIKRFKL